MVRHRATGLGIRRAAAAACLALAFTLAPAAVPNRGTAWAEAIGASRSGLIRTLLPSVVNISVTKPEEQPDNPAEAGSAAPQSDRPIKTYVGSGFVIDPSGLIVTNFHVVDGAFQITVTLSDGTQMNGKMGSASRLADLAVVKVTPPAGHPLTAVHWGDSDKLGVGDQVFAAGNPFGIGLSVSAGIVSGLNRDIQNSPYDDLIQTDATINHGNSGGPLFDMQGNVVGVNSAIISPTSGSAGLGFAIPSNTARFVIDRLRTYGWVRPAWIGVKLQQITPDIAQAIGMNQIEGSILAWVLPNSPAQRAGLQIGDVILRYNDKLPTDERALLRDIAQTPVGDTMWLQVRRGTEVRRVAVIAQEWPRDQWDKRDAPMEEQRPKVVIPPDLGLTLSRVRAEQKATIGLEGGLDGVMVTGVAPNSDPARRGMASGDVILRVQDKPVATPADVQAGIDAARGEKRAFVLMLVLPKVREMPGPKWVALALGSAGG